MQQNGVVSREEMSGFVSIADRRDSVVCPKPRRVGVHINDPSRPHRWYLGYLLLSPDSFIFFFLFEYS